MNTTSKPSSGWNRSSSTPKPAPKKPSAFKGVLAGVLIVAALGAVCWFMFANEGTDAPKAEKRREAIKEVNPAKIKQARKSLALPAKLAKNEKLNSLVEKLDEKPKIKVREISPEEWYRLTNRTFRTGLEQTMSILFSTEPGNMVLPPFPMSDEDKKDITAILISKNEIGEKDDEMTAFCKQQVDRAKKEMAKYIGDGGDPEGFLNYYFQELQLAFNKRNDAIEQLRETKEEDPELAEQMRELINEKLEEDGIKPINKEAY